MVMRLEVTLGDLNRFLDLIDELELKIWLDGGWCVDALLGEQTRRHSDLDIVIQKRDVEKLRNGLTELGFEDIDTDDRSDWNFVMASESGKRIDFHVIELDEHGRGIYGPPEDLFIFPASALRGTGSVDGREVRCLTAEYEVRSHTGYPLKETDFADVYALHDRFGIPLPAEYR